MQLESTIWDISDCNSSAKIHLLKETDTARAFNHLTFLYKRKSLNSFRISALGIINLVMIMCFTKSVVFLKDFKYLRNTFISWCYLLPPSPSDFSKMDLQRQFHLSYPESYQRQSTRPIRGSLRCIRKFSLSHVFDFGLWCLSAESSWSPSITTGYMMSYSSTWNKL